MELLKCQITDCGGLLHWKYTGLGADVQNITVSSFKQSWSQHPGCDTCGCYVITSIEQAISNQLKRLSEDNQQKKLTQV